MYHATVTAVLLVMITVILSLIPPILWAASNVIDARLVECDRDPWALAGWTGCFLAVVGTIAMVLSPFAIPTAAITGLAAIAAGLGILVYVPYLYALRSASVSSVALMWNGIPLMLAVWSTLALHDSLPVTAWIGAVAIGASSAYFEGVRGRASLRAFVLMATACILATLEVLALDMLFDSVPFRTAWPLHALFSGFWGVSILVLRAPSLTWRALVPSDALGLRALLASQALDAGAQFFLGLALMKSTGAIVKSIGGIQPLIAAVILALWPKPGSTSMIRRSHVVATILAMAGLWLIGVHGD